MNDKIEQLKEEIADSQKIVFFGGAGVSTESGIPDFRSAEGLYMKETGTQFSAEEMVSDTFFKQQPKMFFENYFKNLVFADAEPNEAHIFLKELENKGKDVRIVTQNIDGLHQKAGSSIVHELHGSILRNHCTQCGTTYDLAELELDKEGIPRCPKDGAIIKPDVVLYGEMLDQNTIEQSVQDIQEADMMIIAGTSLIVYPAAGLINYFNGKYLVAINKTPITVPSDTLVFEDSISTVFAKL